MEETKQTYKNVVGGAGSSTESEHANTHFGYQYAAAAFSSHYPSVTYYLAFASLINAHMLLIATYHPMCYLASHSLGPTTSMLPISHSTSSSSSKLDSKNYYHQTGTSHSKFLLVDGQQ